MIVRTLLTKLGFQVDSGGVQKAERELGKFKDQAKKTDRVTGGLTGRIMGLASAYLSLQGIIGAAGSIFNANAEYQTIEAGFKSITGSAEGARAEMERLEELTLRTPFNFNEVTEAARILGNLNMDNSNASIEALGDVAVGSKKSVTEVALAFAKATSFEFERLRDMGIVAKQSGDKVAFTFRGQTTEVKKSGKEIEKFLWSLANTEFGGTMSEAFNTLGGQLSSLQDRLFFFMVRIGQNGLSGALIKLLETVTDMTAGAEDFAAVLGQKLGGVVDFVRATLDRLRTSADLLRGGLLLLAGPATLAAIALLRTAMTRLSLAMALPALKAIAIAAAIALLYLAIDELVGFAQGKDSLLGEILPPGAQQSLRQFLSEFQPLIAAVRSAATEAWPLIQEVSSNYFGLLLGFWGTVGRVWLAGATVMAKVYAAVFVGGLRLATLLYQGIAAGLQRLKGVIEFLKGFWSVVGPVVEAAAKKVTDKVGSFFGKVADKIGSAFQRVKGVVTDILKFIGDKVKKVPGMGAILENLQSAHGLGQSFGSKVGSFLGKASDIAGRVNVDGVSGAALGQLLVDPSARSNTDFIRAATGSRGITQKIDQVTIQTGSGDPAVIQSAVAAGMNDALRQSSTDFRGGLE